MAQIRVVRQSVASEGNRAQLQRMLARLVSQGWQIMGVAGDDPVVVILQKGESGSHVPAALELDL